VKMAATENDLRYPIGKFSFDRNTALKERSTFIRDIGELPVKIRIAVAGLTDEQMKTPYRPEGWTLDQVIHHLADSHINSFTRFKLALTEDIPTIKVYREELWAETREARDISSEISLRLLDALHDRWFVLLQSLNENQFSRKLKYPDDREVDLNYMTVLYSWHGRHHTEHINSLRKSKGW